MLKKKIKFKTFDDVELVDDFFFNLSKAELVRLELDHTTAEYEGFAEYVQAAIDRKDGRTIAQVVEDLILTSYGQKSADGKRFMKSEGLKSEFKNSDAYSELFFELVTDSDKAIAFMNGVIPQNLESEMDKIRAAQEPQQNDTSQGGGSNALTEPKGSDE